IPPPTVFSMSLFLKDDSIQIREVWSDNLQEEMDLIREVVDDFPYVAMDTEFPGIVVRPVGTFKSNADYHYETLKLNVNILNIIQLGLTFSNEQGNLPTCGTDNKYCIWQFNFREFDLDSDIFAVDSIDLLKQSGIDFAKNTREGIESRRFAELLMSSGIVLNGNVHWVTFHSGYDFGYLLKLLTCQNLPDSQTSFFELINVYFPTVYDIKHLMKFCNSLHGGLNKLAELLEVERVGICHQAGSDSLLTSCTFRKLKENFFVGPLQKYAGVFDEADPVIPPVAEAAAIPEDHGSELTLRKSRAHGGVTDHRACGSAMSKLVKALCADHNINLLTVPNANNTFSE
ncbi:hypothetical protein HID58_028141, partial [Brassica napus]